MELPEMGLLLIPRWQFFGTLTFKSENLTVGMRQKMYFALLREVAGWWHIYFKRLLWVQRIEQGEATGRLHFHCLIGGLPDAATFGSTLITRKGGGVDCVNRTTHAMEAFWGRFHVDPADEQNRISRFSLYDARLNGAAYITKCLGDERGRLARDAYEFAKFGVAGRQLILAESVLKVAAASRGLSARSSHRRTCRAVPIEAG